MKPPPMSAWLLPHTCRIERPIPSKGKRGAVVETRTPVGSPQPQRCFRQPKSESRLANDLQHDGRQATDVVYLGTQISPPKKGDFVIQGDDTLEVLSALDVDKLNHHWELVCQLME